MGRLRGVDARSIAIDRGGRRADGPSLLAAIGRESRVTVLPYGDDIGLRAAVGMRAVAGAFAAVGWAYGIPRQCARKRAGRGESKHGVADGLYHWNSPVT